MSKTRGGGARFAAISLVVGLGAGLAIYWMGDHWAASIPEKHGVVAPIVVAGMALVGTMAAAFLLLAEAGAMARAALFAPIIGFALAGSTYYVFNAMAQPTPPAPAPAVFWFAVGGPLAAFLAVTVAKAAIGRQDAPFYTRVYFHGLTLPLIAAGAVVFAALSLVLLYTWAGLLKAMNVDLFHETFRKAWFFIPFIGGMTGLSVALIRGLDATLGALRFVLLLFCRIVMPITAVFSLTLIAALLANGLDPIFARPYPGAVMMALALAGMLIFNGVYQNGEGGPPPLWLRVSTIVSLATFPVYALLAGYALWLRVDQYGLSPLRVIGLAANTLTGLYSLVCLAGLVTELRWKSARWMPLVAPLNLAMAGLWVAVMFALASPILDPWALSARNQERRLLSGAASLETFDFRNLAGELGAPGRRALQRLAETPDGLHENALAIRTAATLALEGRSVRPSTPPVDESAAQPAPGRDGPEDLEFNPPGADPDPGE